MKMRLLKNKIKQQKIQWGAIKGKKGTTLIELVVTFALMAFFFACATQVIGLALDTYHKMQGLNYSRQVADTLMEKMVGSIEGAWVIASEETSEGKVLEIYENGTVIEFIEKSGSHIAITTTDNQDKIRREGVDFNRITYDFNGLLLFYYPVISQTVNHAAVDWTYDKAMYMGFEINELKFSLAGADYPKNVIKIVLTLKHNKYGTFSTTRYVECYNFMKDSDFEKIEDEG